MNRRKCNKKYVTCIVEVMRKVMCLYNNCILSGERNLGTSIPVGDSLKT